MRTYYNKTARLQPVLPQTGSNERLFSQWLQGWGRPRTYEVTYYWCQGMHTGERLEIDRLRVDQAWKNSVKRAARWIVEYNMLASSTLAIDNEAGCFTKVSIT